MSIYTVSVDCASGGHQFCTGRRFVQNTSTGPLYGRCACTCHRTGADAPSEIESAPAPSGVSGIEPQ